MEPTSSHAILETSPSCPLDNEREEFGVQKLLRRTRPFQDQHAVSDKLRMKDNT
jgi:hypothetical protein